MSRESGSRNGSHVAVNPKSKGERWSRKLDDEIQTKCTQQNCAKQIRKRNESMVTGVVSVCFEVELYGMPAANEEGVAKYDSFPGLPEADQNIIECGFRQRTNS